MPQTSSRRQFIRQSALLAGALPALPLALSSTPPAPRADLPKIHIFSKHLQFLDYADLAFVAAELGFDGVDLTVRPQGHVLPEQVETDLPKAVDALKRAGLSPLLLTTAVDDASDPTSVRLLKTAAGLGFRYYRMNWFHYDPKRAMPDTIGQCTRQLTALGQLNKTLNLTGCYQNHAGLLVGASAWELWEMLKNADPSFMGVQYDIRHATVEGGLSWPNGLRLLHDRIQTIVLKDCRWANINGQWTLENTPIGEGMVDFTAYFRLLRQYGIQAPVSLHLEYPLGGAENGATRLTVDRSVVFAAMKRDLARVKALWLAA